MKIFEKSFFGGDMSTTAMDKYDTKSICFLCSFFQNSLIFVVDKVPHSQGTTPYLGISKKWSMQLLLFDFVIMQW